MTPRGETFLPPKPIGNYVLPVFCFISLSMFNKSLSFLNLTLIIATTAVVTHINRNAF